MVAESGTKVGDRDGGVSLRLGRRCRLAARILLAVGAAVLLAVVQSAVLSDYSGKSSSSHLGGFDTHSDQLAQQDRLYTQLSQALGAFYQATVEIGVGPQVTTLHCQTSGGPFAGQQRRQ